MGASARLLSLRAVEDLLSLSSAQVTELVRTGALPVLRILDVWRVEAAALDRLIDEARERSRPSAAPCGPPADGTPAGPAPPRAHHPGTPSTSPPPTTGRMTSTFPPRGAAAAPGGRDGLPPRRAPAPAPDGATALASLTAQQRRVLVLLGEGLSNAQIAERLTLETSTVKSHVQRLLRTLQLPDRGHLIAFAWRTRLLGPPDEDRPPPDGTDRPGR